MIFSSEEHPVFKVRGVIERKHRATPLISYLDFPNAADFGGNILDPMTESNKVVEKFAKVQAKLPVIYLFFLALL